MIDNQPTLWQPQEGPQEEFCESSAFECLYGGAKGGGKSDALLFEGTRQIHIPQYRAIIFRREYDQLTRLIERSQEKFPSLGAEWKDSKKTWVFPSGAKYLLRQMEHEKDITKYDGQEFHYMAFDELTHFLEKMYRYMIGMCRTTNPEIECYIRSSAMPKGIGITWVKKRFVDMGPYKIITDEETGLTRQFIPAKLEDNKILTANDPQYDSRLKLMGPKLYKALRMGDWDTIEGASFEELDKTIHMKPPHEPPPGALIWRALDWGFAKPFSVGWYYEDCDGNVTRFREWYGCKENESDTGLRMESGDVAKGIKEIDALYPTLSHGVADPSIWSKDDGPSVAENMEIEGIGWYPAKNDRIQGKMQIHARLQRGAFFVTSNCKHWWRCMPMLQADPRKPEDVDTKMEDHNYDETRYGLMDRPFGMDFAIDLGEDRASCGMQ